jgi:hypothetical protein
VDLLERESFITVITKETVIRKIENEERRGYSML